VPPSTREPNGSVKYLSNLAFNLVLNRHFAAAHTSCEEAQGLVDEIGDRIQKTSRKWVLVFVPGGEETHTDRIAPRDRGEEPALPLTQRFLWGWGNLLQIDPSQALILEQVGKRGATFDGIVLARAPQKTTRSTVVASSASAASHTHLNGSSAGR
jgi:hypothetical protein